MTNPLRTTAATQIGILFLRLSLGAVFLLYGIEKFANIGVTSFVRMNTRNLPSFPPKPVGETYLYAIPFLEVLVGALLIAGLFTRTTAIVTALMLGSYIFAATGVAERGNWMHLQFNVPYLAMALAIATLGGGSVSLDKAIFKTK